MKGIDISYKKVKLKRKEIEKKEIKYLNDILDDLLEIEKIIKQIEEE